MKKIFAALTATLVLAVASPVVASEAEKSFTHEGVTYTYNQTQVGKSTVIEGQANSGQKFRLVKRGSQVTGTFDGSSVSFRTDELVAYRSEAAIPLASR